jgi:hypothetical protein
MNNNDPNKTSGNSPTKSRPELFPPKPSLNFSSLTEVKDEDADCREDAASALIAASAQGVKS